MSAGLRVVAYSFFGHLGLPLVGRLLGRGHQVLRVDSQRVAYLVDIDETYVSSAALAAADVRPVQSGLCGQGLL